MRFHELAAALQASTRFMPSGDRETAMRLASSQKFYCGDVTNIPRSELPEHIPRLPFPCSAFEFAFADDLKKLVVEIVLAFEIEGELRTLHFGRWLRQWMFLGTGRIFNQPDGVKIQASHSSLVPEKLRAAAEADIFQDIAYLELFLNVLNCSNVSTSEILAPDRLNKKRAKKGIGPIYSYHVLTLRRSMRTAILGSSDHASPRVHLRRGHIKRRKTGNFWWQPCVVGDRKRGLLLKDYDASELPA